MAWIAVWVPYIGFDIQKFDTGMRHVGFALESVGAGVARIDRDWTAPALGLAQVGIEKETPGFDWKALDVEEKYIGGAVKIRPADGRRWDAALA